jgi:hypothetical protein
MNTKYILAPLLALALVTPACIFVVHDGDCDVDHWHSSAKTTPGSRVEASETRTVAAFQRIELSGSIDLEAEIGGDASAAPEVVVRADDNLIGLLETESNGGTLVVRWKKSDLRPDPRVEPRVRVRVPVLERLSLTGSGDATVRGLSGGTFGAQLAGSGDVTLKGRVERLNITVSGSGDVDAFGLDSVEARVTCSGSGDVRVKASDRVDAAVSGSGDVRYRGNPKTVERSVAGSGTVESDGGGS